MKNIRWIFLFAVSQSFGQAVWTSNLNPDVIDNYKASYYQLNQDVLQKAMVENPSFFELNLPLPDNHFRTFKFTESALLSPELQRKYPEIKTYKGVNALGEIARIDISDQGFHGIFFSKNGTVFIDPVSAGSKNVKSYYESDYKHSEEHPAFVENEPVKIFGSSFLRKPQGHKRIANRSNGEILKKYRIAIAVNSAYASFHGGTVASTLAAIVTTLNRVTGIYENELAITFELVGNNDQIIYTSSENDPYFELDNEEALDKNQENLDKVIGSENYDIGHLLVGNDAGQAFLSVVCSSTAKAKGITGLTSPIGDPFDVDFFAHEIGHQFGAEHTFNGTLGSCRGTNRNAETAVEPGSGSTIMAYAGICFGDDLQNNSDPYFHGISLNQIATFVTSGLGATCPQTSNTGNNLPTLRLPASNFSIPVSTPFRLTATGEDNDNSSLTFNWEQINLGPAGSPDSPEDDAPIFRSLPPSESPTRYFPAMADLLKDTSTFGEVLPDEARNLDFIATVRDNNSAGGGFDLDTLSFSVHGNAGPFLVTSQNTGSQATGGQVQLITWDVADTDQSPINSSTVRILLSADGGETFDNVLVENTPNDGREYVLFPNITSDSARIMVEAVDNIFFNVNPGPFIIEPTSTPDFTIFPEESSAISCGNTIRFPISSIALNEFEGQIDFSLDAELPNISSQFSASTIAAGETVTISFENRGDPANERATVIASSGEKEIRLELDLSFADMPDENPESQFPEDNAIEISSSPFFSWLGVANASSYEVEISRNDKFTDLISKASSTETSISFSEILADNTTYFWRVIAENECGTSDYSESRTFITANTANSETVASDGPISIIGVTDVTSSIVILEDFEISDVDVNDIQITHTWSEDLTVTLTSPSNTEIELFSRLCGNSDNIFISFDDDGESTDIPCPATDQQSYQPSGNLAAFNGESSKGSWILTVKDEIAGDDGILVSWALALGFAENNLRLFTESPSPNSIALDWSDIQSNNGYEVEINAGDGFSKIGETAANISSFVSNNLTSNTAYTFRVRAKIGNGFSDYSNQSPVTTNPDIPNAPSELQGNQVPDVSVELQWTDNSDVEEGFIIERSDLSNGIFTEIGRTKTDETEFVDDNPIGSTNFTYRVSAFNITGESSTSNELVLAVLGISAEPVTKTVFPNPVTDRIGIQGHQGVQHLMITDINGKRLWNDENPESASISTAFLRQGLYFLHVLDDEDWAVYRFIKTN